MAKPPHASPRETSRADWLPWCLAIFGAGCAAFVLLTGVLPARTENAHLMQRVAHLETTAQSASSERDSLAQAKGHLLAQYTSVQAQISNDAKERERARQAQELARKEMGETFTQQIAGGDVWLETAGNASGGADSQGELVIGIRDRVLFNGDHGEVTWKGRKFLQALAENLKHLPADQLYEIGGHFEPSAKAASSGKSASGKSASDKSAPDKSARSSWELSAKRAASVAAFLQGEGGVSGSQLVAAGFSQYRPAADVSRNRRIEIVLKMKPAR